MNDLEMKSSPVKVAHITSAHQRYDTRIFLKQCNTLSQQGYDVSLIVADGLGHETKSGVNIIDVGRSAGRLNRFVKTTDKIYKKVLELNPDIVHFHDPDLLPVGVKIKKTSAKVIFDSHENVSKQILEKAYISPFARHLISGVYKFFEDVWAKKLDCIITATPSIEEFFLNKGCKVRTVANFPIETELVSDDIDWSAKQNSVCYVGGMTQIRGVLELIEAMEIVEGGVRLRIAGTSGEPHFQEKLDHLKKTDSVEFLGFQSRAAVKDLFAESFAGVVTFLNAPNHIDAQPNKMFEYMSAGLPIIASNFPLWKEIVEGNNCGICVDPSNPEEIALAINRLSQNMELARQMGENGKRAVSEKYNWEAQARVLNSIYRDLLAT